MGSLRRSYEAGHKPKCLVIVDDSAEWDRAVYYASRWAVRAGGAVVMLRVIEILDQNQQWLGVADVMRAEAIELAETALDRASGRANGIAAITPERVIREGDPLEQVRDVIEHDSDIAMLVLAASGGRGRAGAAGLDHGPHRRHVPDPGDDRAGQSQRRRGRRAVVSGRGLLPSSQGARPSAAAGRGLRGSPLRALIVRRPLPFAKETRTIQPTPTAPALNRRRRRPRCLSRPNTPPIPPR